MDGSQAGRLQLRLIRLIPPGIYGLCRSSLRWNLEINERSAIRARVPAMSLGPPRLMIRRR